MQGLAMEMLARVKTQEKNNHGAHQYLCCTPKRTENLLNIIVSSNFCFLILMVSFKCMNVSVTADAFLSLPHSKHKRRAASILKQSQKHLSCMMQKKKKAAFIFFPSVRTTSPDPAVLVKPHKFSSFKTHHMQIYDDYIYFFFRCAFHSLRGCVPSSGSVTHFNKLRKDFWENFCALNPLSIWDYVD